ncbi:RNA polymerase subunit sigma-70 [Rathayibacter tritici]|nr:RNA polymerase subunit sigma-70 [Rathayibacter tritici]PPI12323.1 RNA polymerase subunit sigma-70 [Rathayibacter tritici]PPI42317.1 RNA polymerase subunit sigma-70 [Rathayibacter tritici]
MILPAGGGTAPGIAGLRVLLLPRSTAPSQRTPGASRSSGALTSGPLVEGVRAPHRRPRRAFAQARPEGALMSTIDTGTGRPSILTEAAREEKDARTLALFQAAVSAEAAEGDRIRERIVLDHLGLAEAMAHRISRGGGARAGGSPGGGAHPGGAPAGGAHAGGAHAGGDWADLRQVAYVGLVKAARRFTPDRGESFAAFAVPTITGELKRHLRDLGWMIRPPRGVQELHRRSAVVADELAQEFGRHPTDHEIARRLGVDAADVADARSAGHPLSLDETVGEGGAGLGDTLGGEDARLVEIDRRHGLAEALAELEEGQRELLRMRFVEERTQQQIADALGTTQMQVSRLQRRILAQLADRLGAPSRNHQPRAARARVATVTPVRPTTRLKSA